jgi:hypothetical protein
VSAASPGVSETTVPTPSELWGTWDLVSFRVVADDGRPDRFPFGPDAKGRIVYAPDGYMMAVLSRTPEGAPPALQRLESAHHASDADKAAAFDRYLSYSGRWVLVDGEVHHHVDLALVPGVPGRVQVRAVSLVREPNPTLTLSYEQSSTRGTRYRFVLVWHRPPTE